MQKYANWHLFSYNLHGLATRFKRDRLRFHILLIDNLSVAYRTSLPRPVLPDPRNRKSPLFFWCRGFCAIDRHIDLEYLSRKLAESKIKYQAFRHRILPLSTDL